MHTPESGRTPESSRTPESGAGNGLIVAYEAGNHLHRYGARVYGDGRYEQFSTSHPGETPHWERFDPFGERSTGAIADAVDAALAARIPDQISAGDPPPPDAATAHVTLRDREIEVGNWPKNAPAELQHVLDTIAEQRRRPPTPTHLGVVEPRQGRLARGRLRRRRGRRPARARRRVVHELRRARRRAGGRGPAEGHAARPRDLLRQRRRCRAVGVRRRTPRRSHCGGGDGASAASAPTSSPPCAARSRPPTGARCRPGSADPR